MVTLCKVSSVNVNLSNDKCEYKSPEGCVLVGEEGGMTRCERVEDKKIDGAKQKTEREIGQR